ncbi:LuxR C-terminal-related transcriptional regulator [Adlercreutzia equolifaciens]|uniref:LuxR C-terminal-related transcriptional regulator n=1 Tax=Adlercreutzia equolifaciens TaxID=446660 RepID=UPI0032BF9DEE
MSATTHAREPIEGPIENTTEERTDDAARQAADCGTPAEGEGETRRRRPVDDAALLNFLIVVLGFGLCRAWIVFCLGAPLVFPAASPTHWIYLASGALCAAIVALICRAGGNAIALMRRLLFRITPFALLASGILIPLAIRTNSELLMACGFVAGGIGAGPLQVLWGDRFSHHSVHFAAFASPAAAIVTASVAALSSSQTSFMGFIVVPLLSFGLLVFHADRTGHPWRELIDKSDPDSSWDSAPQSAVAEPAEAAAQPTGFRAGSRVPLGVGKLMFSIMTFSLLCRMFDTMNSGEDPLAFLGGSPIFALVVVGAAFIAIVAKAGDRFNPTFIYRLSLPIMVAGYVAIALLFDSHAAISLLIINVGYEFFDILTWVLFVDASRRRNENALYIFGLGVAFMFCGMALGNAASHILDTLVAGGNVQANVVAMAAILCLVIVAFLVLPEGTVAQLSRREGHAERGEEPTAENNDLAESEAKDSAAGDGQADGAATADRIERHCAAVARDFGLTPRESEVIVLLAYGRTLAIIARDLHIAQGTARTHIENIYRKLDVHKQQELIDLVENHEG